VESANTRVPEINGAPTTEAFGGAVTKVDHTVASVATSEGNGLVYVGQSDGSVAALDANTAPRSVS
jgi:hypothetical protein